MAVGDLEGHFQFLRVTMFILTPGQWAFFQDSRIHLAHFGGWGRAAWGSLCQAWP